MLTSSSTRRLSLVGAACALSLLSAGCSSVNDLLGGDKVDYRSSGNKTVNLEVPPDLSQLSGQGRYTHANTGGTVSANTYNQQQAQAAGGPSATSVVATNNVGGVTLERDGQTRWLSVNQPPEQVWPLVRDFWLENGFELPVDQAQTGLMETNWSENRARLQQGGLRQLVGKLLDNLYDTGERDQFRTRIERTPRGAEIYISHRGLQEVYVDATRKDQTTWKARPSDPELEAQMLSRLMVKLGMPKEAAQAAVQASAGQGTGNASSDVATVRVLSDGLTLSLLGDFDQAWRRVGLALDRGGFTVEDRDRSGGVYEVRLASTPSAQSQPGLLSRMFNWFGDKDKANTLTRYRIKVTGESGSNASTVTVLGSDNKPADTAGGREVARQLSINLE